MNRLQRNNIVHTCREVIDANGPSVRSHAKYRWGLPLTVDACIISAYFVEKIIKPDEINVVPGSKSSREKWEVLSLLRAYLSIAVVDRKFVRESTSLPGSSIVDSIVNASKIFNTVGVKQWEEFSDDHYYAAVHSCGDGFLLSRKGSSILPVLINMKD